jgi:hypothetical protein
MYVPSARDKMRSVKDESAMLKRHRLILAGEQTGVEAELQIRKMFDRYRKIVGLKLRKTK